MSEPSAPGDEDFKNAVAVEAINEKLAEVTGLAEELDQALRSAHQDSSVPATFTIPVVVTTGSPGDGASTSTEVGGAVFDRSWGLETFDEVVRL